MSSLNVGLHRAKVGYKAPENENRLKRSNLSVKGCKGITILF